MPYTFNSGHFIWLRFQFEIINSKPLIAAIMTKYQGVEIFVIPQYRSQYRLNIDICKLSKFCARSIVTGIEAFL